MDALLHGIAALGQPLIGSIYDEEGTPESGYAENGPYHCEDCIHKTAPDEPFCIHPKMIGDSRLQDRLTMIDGRPTIKVDLCHGCCRYVRQARDDEKEAEDDHGKDE